VLRRLLPAILLILSVPACAGTLSAWSQYGADGTVEARVVTDDAVCPALSTDGRERPMSLRQQTSTAFPVHVCVGTIPTGAKKASAGGVDLPVPVAQPRHIVLLGDTGCRLKGAVVQNCNDESFWPFHRVAARAAREHPDLVIHVGDYLYRETPCQAGDSRCAGTPSGDNWPTWNADFFLPGADLLHAAVWVAERGNHEDCKRAGLGWTTLLGRAPAAGACQGREAPMFVDLGGVKLAVLDDNDANDVEVKQPATDELHRDIAAAIAAHADWTITHHPFRGVSKPVATEKGGDGKIVEGANATLVAALQGLDLSGLTLMLSGHIHNFQIENYAAPLPPQLIVGEGGDNLDTEVPARLTGLVSGGQAIASGMSLPGFGYVVIDRIGHGKDWDIAVKAVDGTLLRHCSLKSRKLACKE
jgi:hypothetical protein